MSTPTNPIAYPFARDATFTSAGPSIGSAFLNQTQDGLLYTLGALQGRSYTFEIDDFDRVHYGAAQFGSLRVDTNTNGAGTMSTGRAAPGGPGEHGIWACTAPNAAAFSFACSGATNDIGTLDTLFSAKVKIVKRSRLETQAAGGFAIGLLNVYGASEWIDFVAGSDQANWWATCNGVSVDTGVNIIDGSWYDLQAARQAGSTTFYINGALVATSAGLDGVAVATARRRILTASPAANVGDGFYIDYFKAGYQR